MLAARTHNQKKTPAPTKPQPTPDRQPDLKRNEVWQSLALGSSMES